MATTVADLKREAEELGKKRIKLYNPDIKDFTVQYSGKSYVIHSQELEEFPYHIAKHIKKHLITHLINKRGVKSGNNVENTRREIAKEIEVEI